MKPSFLILVAAIGALAAGCGASQTYSIDETREAFERQGYTLIRPSASQFPDAPEGILLPRGSERFSVFVSTDAEADAAWPDYDRLQDKDSFDVRRANVVVISDGGLTAAHRDRVKSALAALPDRDNPIVVAGDE